MTTQKPLFKSKFSIIYESILKGEDQSESVWEELFLIKVNVGVLEEIFNQLSSTELVALKGPINKLFSKCVDGLKEEHSIKSLNILMTLSCVVRCVWRRDLGEGFRAVDVLVGFDQAETILSALLGEIHKILVSSQLQDLKFYALTFLKILLTASDNISQNTMVEYLMLQPLWYSLCKVIVSPILRTNLGSPSLSLLALLLNYRKHEYSNVYSAAVAACDDELLLNGFGEILLNYISRYNDSVLALKAANSPTYSEYISSWIYWTAPVDGEKSTKLDLSLLLCLYEVVHLNRSFTTVLTQTMSSNKKRHDSSDSQGEKGEECHSNLISSFLTFTSLVLSNVKENGAAAHLCFDILLCISEDNYANAFMHDDNQVFSVFIYRTKLRHRKDPKNGVTAMSLAYTLLDLLSEFLMTNLTKNCPLQLYSKCYRVIHRVLCYEKKCRVRLAYPWATLWSSVIAAVKWFNSLNVDDPELIHNYIQVGRIFNMFVMYGDTFLPNPGSYDELYYELLRQHAVFDSLNQSALQFSNRGASCKESCKELLSNLHNIRAIVNHFSPKIEAWSTASKISTPSPEEVMDIVRSNYDTLTLKLQDGLDHFERYTEVPREQQFFTTLVRGICAEKREKTRIQIESSSYHKFTTASHIGQ